MITTHELVSSPSVWGTLNESNIARNVERIWLRPGLDEIYDIEWSPDSSHIVAGAIDCKVKFSL